MPNASVVEPAADWCAGCSGCTTCAFIPGIGWTIVAAGFLGLAGLF